MSEKLKEGSYYLIELNREIREIKCIRVTNYCYYIMFMQPKDKETPLWIKKYNVGSNYTDGIRLIEELDPIYYRQQKLKRIIKED